ncbi:MAG: M3 family metallopeptidase [Myxococcota bacterium]
MNEPNPLLLDQFDLPFDQIQSHHVVPGLTLLLETSKKALQGVKVIDGERTWDNTLAALEEATRQLELAYGVVMHLRSVCHTDELAAAIDEMVPHISQFFSSIALDAELYAAIKAFAATDEAHALEGVRKRYLDKTLRDFVRHGAELAPEQKTRLAAIDMELAQLGNAFSQAVLKATAEWELHLPSDARLDGLPASALGMLAAAAHQKGLEGYRVTLQAPHVIAITTYATDRALREQVWRGYNRRAADENPSRIVGMLALRQEKATLLGYSDFADYVLEERMAGTGAAARTFVDGLATRTRDAFERERGELSAHAAAMGLSDLQPWDVGFVSENLRRARFDLDEEELRPYFSFERVRDGMFQLVKDLYGIEVRPTTLPVWHDDVETYAVFDESNHHIGSFYADFFPRESKRGGAWMNAFITGSPEDSGRLGPHLGLICGNVTPPLDGTPSLMTHREVETLFHEFGHLLHHLLTEVELRGLAGTNVAWDFVELPSQIMENWCWEREALDLIAVHHETGEALPEALFEKMTRARTFRAASGMMRQLSFGTVDLKLHTEFDAKADVLTWARDIMSEFSAVAPPEDYAMIASFGHLFSGPTGYAAGYYSYKWAEVLDADAFSRFKREGVFNRETGAAFRSSILAMGDADDPMNLFRAFMGRDPDPEALMARSGLS